LPTTIKLKIAGHTGINVLTVNLAQLPAGDYRLAATPLALSGAPETTQYLNFKAVR